jgi:hypothetical protein
MLLAAAAAVGWAALTWTTTAGGQASEAWQQWFQLTAEADTDAQTFADNAHAI